VQEIMNDKIKVMFDSNVFDLLHRNIDLLKKNENKYEVIITTIQIEELCRIPDCKLEERIKNFIMLVDIRARLVPSSIFVLSKSRLNYGRLGIGEVYNKILKPSKRNINDAIIADTAVCENCCLVTEDIELYNKLKENGYETIMYNDFIELIRAEK
jgi:rRNA-processing protein FCF1